MSVETRLLIIVVNYGTAELTLDCLRSLEYEVEALPDARVTVVDNGSSDDSAGRIQEAIDDANWQRWVDLMPLDHNVGFAGGNNAAVRPALESGAPPSYIFLLNSDTIVLPGALAGLMGFMEANPEVGVAGSRIEDGEGNVRCSAFRFSSVGSELVSGLRLGFLERLFPQWVVSRPILDAPYQTDWVSGASMMIRRETLETAGLLDEGYFMYYEDMDFCLAAKRLGRWCWYVPQSRVIHLEGGSSGVVASVARPKRLPKYYFESRRRYFVKNYGVLKAALADALWICGFTVWRTRRRIQRKPDRDPPKLLRDFMSNSILKNPASWGQPWPTGKKPSEGK